MTLDCLRIESHTLAYVKTELYRQEGFATPREFEEYWNGLHPRKRYQPNQLVWVHFFRKLPEGLT